MVLFTNSGTLSQFTMAGHEQNENFIIIRHYLPVRSLCVLLPVEYRCCAKPFKCTPTDYLPLKLTISPLASLKHQQDSTKAMPKAHHFA